MSTPANLFQVLLDLWFSIIKLLGRPVVQAQLLAAFAALALAWLLTKWITRFMRRRHAARAEIVREQLIDEARLHLADAGDDDEEAEQYVLLLSDETLLANTVNRWLGWGRRIHLLALQMVFPVLAIVLLFGARFLFVTAGWYSGLLSDLIVLARLFFVYRLGMGLAYTFANESRVTYYRNRLFGPLVAVVVTLLVLNTVGDLNALASATILPQQEGWLTLGVLFLAIFGFYVWVMMVNLIKDMIRGMAGRKPSVDLGSLDAVLVLAQYGLVALGFLAVFKILQIDTTTIAAITGGLFIGVGFALQDVLKNFIGGIIVLFEGSVRPGDWVEVAGTEGEIDKLSIRATVVRTLDNVEYIVPNQEWFSSTVKTFTRSSRVVRLRLPVDVGPNADPHSTQQLLVDTVKQHPDVIAEPSPMAPLIDFGASKISFVVLAWIEDAKLKDKVSAELRLLIWDALEAHNIEVQ